MIPFKLINYSLIHKKNYKLTSNSTSDLDPWFITGYTDGEGSFSIKVKQRTNTKFGFYIDPVYSIGAEINPYNLILLKVLKLFLEK
jgi:hypothetical protein